MYNHIIITVDGTAASGKGTLAKALARHCDGTYMDTGLLYRYVGAHLNTEELSFWRKPESPHNSIQKGLRIKSAMTDKMITITRNFAANFSEDMLDNPNLRNEEASQGASIAAAIPQVREALMQLQKDFAHTLPKGKKCVVMDGRDIGTVVVPNAPIKFFVDAKIEERAKRRAKELQSLGKSDSYEAVLEAMRQRDARDISRDIAPTKAAPDALVIDTTNISVDEMVKLAIKHIKKISPDL